MAIGQSGESAHHPQHPSSRSVQVERLEPRALLSALPGPVSPQAHRATVTGELPTLSVVFLTPFPPSVLPGQHASERVRIYNGGSGPAIGKTTLSLLASGDGTVADAQATLKTSSVSLNLAAGAYEYLTLDFVYAKTLTAGSYHLLADLDPAGLIAKSAGSSDLASSPPITIAPPFVHLGAAIAAAPATAAVLHSVTVVASLTNSGNTAASGSVAINLYESPTPSITRQSTLIDTFSHVAVSVAANSTQRDALTATLPSGVVPGSQYFVASFAPNVKHSDGAAPVAAATFPTVFQTDEFTSVPGAVTVGHRATVGLELNNATAATARGAVSISLYASPTGSIGNGTLLETFSSEPVHVGADASELLDLNLKIPATAPTGTQFLVAVLTAGGSLASTPAANATVVSLSPTTLNPV